MVHILGLALQEIDHFDTQEGWELELLCEKKSGGISQTQGGPCRGGGDLLAATSIRSYPVLSTLSRD